MTTKQIKLMNTRTNHVLHLLLSIVTAGIWIPVWILVALNNADKRRLLENEIENGPTSKKTELIAVAVMVGLAALLYLGGS